MAEPDILMTLEFQAACGAIRYITMAYGDLVGAPSAQDFRFGGALAASS
jgi:hypothetical protein